MNPRMQEYIQGVLAGLAYLHGYSDPTTVPKKYWQTLGAIVNSHKSKYTYGFQMGLDPCEVARRIQGAQYAQHDAHVVSGR